MRDARLRLCVVAPRYGHVVGGAETLCRALVDRCCDGWDVDVLTTTATSHETWADVLPAGTERIGAATVHRFPVTLPPRPRARRGGGGSYLGEVLTLARSVWSAPLHDRLARTAADYDLVLLAPYLFGITFWGAQVDPARTALVPCLHDEAEARTEPMAALFRAVRGCIFNTASERALAGRLYGPVPGGVVGIGLDPVDGPADVEGFRRRHGIAGPYVVYCGRIEGAKRVDRLVHLVRERNRRRPGPVTLVLVGSGSYRPPLDPNVRLTGFLSEEDKRAAFAGAVAFANPSDLESLSITLLEAWREGTPALVSDRSEVLVDHVRASGGGRAVDMEAEEPFAEALELLLGPDERRRVGEAGRAYVAERYAWPEVRARFRATVEEFAAACA